MLLPLPPENQQRRVRSWIARPVRRYLALRLRVFAHMSTPAFKLYYMSVCLIILSLMQFLTDPTALAIVLVFGMVQGWCLVNAAITHGASEAKRVLADELRRRYDVDVHDIH